jgi:hypothetical protein
MQFNGISPKVHGFLDYSYAPLAFLAPKLAGFQDDKAAVRLCQIVGLATLGYSLLTNYQFGAVKKLPYKAHATIDVVAGAFNLASPWILKVQKDKAARNTLLVLGAVSLVAGVLSLLYKED